MEDKLFVKMHNVCVQTHVGESLDKYSQACYQQALKIMFLLSV